MVVSRVLNSLKIDANRIFIHLFVQETQYVLHRGLPGPFGKPICGMTGEAYQVSGQLLGNASDNQLRVNGDTIQFIRIGHRSFYEILIAAQDVQSITHPCISCKWEFGVLYALKLNELFFVVTVWLQIMFVSLRIVESIEKFFGVVFLV